MPSFKYIGGLTHSAYHSEREKIDEREGIAMPDSVTQFGHKFILGQPVEVKQSAFRTQDLFEHAVRKLRANKYFEEAKPKALSVVKDADAK